MAKIIDTFDGPSINSIWSVNFNNTTVGTYSANILNGKLQLTQITGQSGSWVQLEIGKYGYGVFEFDMKLIGTNLGNDSAGVRPYVGILKKGVTRYGYYGTTQSTGMFASLHTLTSFKICNKPLYLYDYGTIYKDFTFPGSAINNNRIKIVVDKNIFTMYINNIVYATINIPETVITYFGNNDLLFEIYIGNYMSGQKLEIDNFEYSNSVAKYLLKSDDKNYTISNEGSVILLPEEDYALGFSNINDAIVITNALNPQISHISKML